MFRVLICYVMLFMLCYGMVVCCTVSCPKNFSAQSDCFSVHLTNKYLNLMGGILISVVKLQGSGQHFYWL